MRLSVNDRVLLAAFGTFAMVSIAIKALEGPPRDGWSDLSTAQVTSELRSRLAAQGFATVVVPRKFQSGIVLAQRGACRLSVRDARGGKALMTQFTRDGATVGPVRYLYGGGSYDVLPGLLVRFARWKTEVMGRFGMRTRAHIPIAIATSPGCGNGAEGLEDVSISA